MAALGKDLDALTRENLELKGRIVKQSQKLMDVERELQKRDTMDVHRTVRGWLEP